METATARPERRVQVKTKPPAPELPPLPANFGEWPLCMRRRYLAHALAAHGSTSLDRSAR